MFFLPLYFASQCLAESSRPLRSMCLWRGANDFFLFRLFPMELQPNTDSKPVYDSFDIIMYRRTFQRFY